MTYEIVFATPVAQDTTEEYEKQFEDNYGMSMWTCRYVEDVNEVLEMLFGAHDVDWRDEKTVWFQSNCKIERRCE